MNFSKHLAIVYTLIIAVPLMLFIMFASEYLRSSLYDTIAIEASKSVADAAAHVEACVDQSERLESIISSDYELLRTFYFADKSDEDHIIETLRTDIKNLERLQFAMPLIYALHIFVNNENIPERWPIVFREDRLDFSRFGRWRFDYREDIMGNIVSNKEPSVCLTSELFLNKRHVGFVQISMKMTDFFPFLNEEKKPYFNTYVLYDNTLLLNSDKNIDSLLREVASDGPDKRNGHFIMRDENENLVVAYSRIPRLNLLLVHTSSPAVITHSIFLIRLTSFFILLASIACMFMIITYVTKKMVTRLYIVMGGMKKIREGNLDVSIFVPGNDEVAEMARTFSAMVERIQRLVSEIKKEQALVTQTEIKAMQNQINAHFLYNVLETIKMQAELKDQHEISESITLLGRMMRYCLRWRNHRVLLKQEIEYVSDYIRLMNIRNDYEISLSIAIDEKYLDFEIPKMLIQPVIENAVLHAIEPLGEDAIIEITASPDDANKILWIQIRDSGAGMDSDQLDRLGTILAGAESDAPVGGIGLQNIQQRLNAFYGRDFSLRIQSAPGKGTEVVIPVPMEKSL